MNTSVFSLLFKLAVCVYLSEMLHDLCLRAFPYQLCAYILLSDAICTCASVFPCSSSDKFVFCFPWAATRETPPACVFFPGVVGCLDLLLWILCRLRFGRRRSFCFLLHVKHAELLVPVVQDICPLFAALSKSGALQIQDDLPEPLYFPILRQFCSLRVSTVICSMAFCCWIST